MQSKLFFRSQFIIMARPPQFDKSTPMTNSTSRKPPSIYHQSSVNSKDLPAQYRKKRKLLQHPSSSRRISIQRFITEVDRDLKEIEKQISQVNNVKDQSIWIKEGDSRIADLYDTRDTSPMTKLRRGLSQRSLAIQFNRWELATYKTSEIERRASRPSVEPARKLGHISTFLKQRSFQDGSAAKNGVQHGMISGVNPTSSPAAVKPFE